MTPDKCMNVNEPILYWNTHVMAYSTPAKVDFDARTNGFVVKNAGNQIVIFDDEPIQPGESKAYGGNKGEIFIGRKDLAFQVPAGFVGTPVNSAFVTVKFYVQLDKTSPNYVQTI